MGLIKNIWNFLFKKNLITQDVVPQVMITALAKKLDDMLDFNTLFKGKLKIFENYDSWAFEQILTLFFATFGKKLGSKAITLITATMNGVANDNLVIAQNALKDYLDMKINIKNISDDVEDAVVFAQVDMVFNILDIYLEKKINS